MADCTPPPTLPRQHSAGGIAYYKGGSGSHTPLLFIHGVGLSCDCWHEQITALQKQRLVFAIDLPGHGGSLPFNKKSPNIDDFVSKIAEFIENKSGAGVAVIGHSLGALIALELAARYPRLISRAAALSAVYARSPAAQQAVQARAALLQQAEGDTTARTSLINATLARWFGDPPQPQQAAAACRGWLLQTAPATYAAAYRVFAEHAAEQTPLRQLTQPLLYLTGGEDANSTADMSRQMAAITPTATAIVIAGHAHMVQMTAAEQVNTALAQWLDGDGSRQTAP